MGQDQQQVHKKYDPAMNNGVKMILGEKCGHHCGVITVGDGKSKARLVRHCPCVECHSEQVAAAS